MEILTIKIGKKKNSKQFNTWALNLLSEQHDEGILSDEEYKNVRRLLIVYLYHDYSPQEYKYIAGMNRLKKAEGALMEEMGIRQPKK